MAKISGGKEARVQEHCRISHRATVQQQQAIFFPTKSISDTSHCTSQETLLPNYALITHLTARLKAAERRPLPLPARYQLEGSGRTLVLRA